MEAFVTPFLANGFMANALAAGVLVAVACGIVGTLVVLRGLAFIGDALAHGVLPGIAIAILLGYPGILGAVAGSIVMIGGIGYLTRRSKLSNDTAIGLFFVGMLALGVVIVSRSRSFSGDLVRILFGELLGTGRAEILALLLVTAFLAIAAVAFRRPFLLLCFSPEQAQVSGYPPRLYHFVMLGMIALTVVVSFQSVGTMLVFGMLLAPAATGALFARRIGTMMVSAGAIGAVAVYLGLLASYHFGLAAGASIALVATAVFFLAFSLSLLARRHATRPQGMAGTGGSP